MTTYPLPTLAAQVDSYGITAPSYEDTLASLKASFKTIFGADAYLEPDSQDGQLLAIFAQAVYDCNQATIAAYNAFSPATALGEGLSSVVKINGLKRLVPTKSTVDVLIIGSTGTTITNGVVEDTNGVKWNLPESVSIPLSGEVTVTATCEVEGAVAAAVGTVTKINTPTRGWQTVTNESVATQGSPTESDTKLRQRQAVSTELAAQSVLGSIVGSVANLTGVEQYRIYENDTDATDANGIPSHSIALIVDGGDAEAIAQVLAQKKTPGTGTYGSTTEVVLDPAGIPVTVNFSRPVEVTINVAVTLVARTGYVSSTGAAVIAALVDAVNNQGIYANDGLLSRTSLIAAVYGVDNSSSFNMTILNIAKAPASPAASDIAVAFNERPVTTSAHVTLVVV